ncbi:peptide-methionine (S)-S-oxide reductase MsrA [Porticoccaceae bacterium]|nr:peptide-methionine (S)-S-oxide reductase MsrA [Porticoccaceae bacterium]
MKPNLPRATAIILLSLFTFVTLKAVAEEQSAIFAGGCFWCTESDFEKLDGVISAASGYIGGHLKNPTYKQVSSGRSGHTEAVEVIYDDQTVSYSELVEYFWKTIDPTDGGGQFCDRGQQYRSEIFYQNEDQRRIAQASKDALAASGLLEAEIATQLTPSSRFYPAEDYHQDYYLKNPVRYNYYRWGCGREKRLAEVWGTPAK